MHQTFFPAGAAKVASHPPKNITEQKMLDSHLYDMSRQRFNFLVQCQWERKLFLEKQRRKTAVMRDLLRNVDLSDQPDRSFSLNRPKKDPLNKSKRIISIFDKEDLKSKTSFENLGSGSLAADVFVTHNFSRSLGPNSVISIGQDENVSHTFTVTSKAERPTKRQVWPLNDLRYTKLNDALCETYPKSVHLQSGSRARTVVDNIRY